MLPLYHGHASARQESEPSLLVRHRWLGEPAKRYWICHPRAVPLWQSRWDPACHGCGAVIAFDDLPDLERYHGSHMVDSLSLRLNLFIEELKLRGAGKNEIARDVSAFPIEVENLTDLGNADGSSPTTADKCFTATRGGVSDDD